MRGQSTARARRCGRTDSAYTVVMARKLAPFLAAISLRPVSSVTLAVPLSTMSVMVENAFADRRSDGAMKLPALRRTAAKRQ